MALTHDIRWGLRQTLTHPKHKEILSLEYIRAWKVRQKAMSPKHEDSHNPDRQRYGPSHRDRW